MNPAVAAWAAEIVLITIRDLGQAKRLPIPSEFLATFIVFGGLAAIGNNQTARRPAGLVAWGIVIASLIGGYETWSNPGGGNGALPVFTNVSNFFAPSPPSQSEIAQAAQNTR